MSRSRREAGVPALLGAVAFVLAFAQRPGWATADTKINLHVDPGRFLSDVASMWTATGQLGDVQTGQQAGYLFPMGPFFALGHAIGLSDWVVQRLWLGCVLGLAAWGVSKLVSALLGRPAVVAPLVAGLITLLNPFVVTYANRTTVTFLAYAALPWLMLAVYRGVRDPRGWRWPAVIALLITASGGGINGAVTAWMLLGPVLLLLYEWGQGSVGWLAVRGFLLRVVPLSVVVSLWWVIPAYIQSKYGISFLHFTEQPGTVWGTTSSTETLRLMSFWLSYAGIGFAGKAIPYFDDSNTMLFSAPVVVASLLLPALALGGFVWTRRWRYGPFFLGLALVAVLVMGAGFPDGTPLRHGLYFAYDHFSAVQFLRASYKAAPLLALALACLGGVAAASVWERVTAVTWRAGLAVAGLAVLVLAAWPLSSGRAQDKQVSYKKIPSAWTQAASDLDRDLPANSRAMVLPGDLFSFYTWGGTVDPILPALAKVPVAERAEVPYADLRSTDLQWTIDGLVHQQRLLPGQLPALLSVIGVRSVITGTDDDLARSDAPPPADAAATLAAQPGFGSPARSYGPVRRFVPSSLGPAVALPEVRRYDLPSSRGIIHVEPRAQPIVVDGSAEGIVELAAFGSLPSNSALLYSADLSPSALRSSLRSGGQLVITDSNRRQAFVAASLEQDAGAVLPPSQNVTADGFILDPFGAGTNAETVASFSGGISSVQAPFSPQIAQFPEHAPFAAVDGNPATAWLADPTLPASDRFLTVDFSAPRSVPFVYLLPYGDAGGTVRQVTIAGREFAVHPGWNRLALGLRGVSSLTVALTDVSPPLPGAAAGAGGISELQIPGVRATEALRLPVDAAGAVRGADLASVGLTYLFERETGDDPFQRDLAHGAWSARDVHAPGDAEQTMRRIFELPAARSFSASAWVEPFSQTPDNVLDRLVGYRGSVVATSSDRFDGEPRYRASMALDGDPSTAWVGDWGHGTAWLSVRTAGPVRLSTLRLEPPALPVRRPTRVLVSWPGGSSGPLPVGPGGLVTLPQPVRVRAVRIAVLAAVAPARATPAEQRAVGIASIGGLPRVVAPRRSVFTGGCGSAAFAVGAAVFRLRVSGSISAFEAGTPMMARSCGPAVPLAAGTQRLSVTYGSYAIDDLRLYSPAPDPVALAASGGAVVDSGTVGHGSYDGVRVSVTSPSWLVLGESYDRGWQATCNGRSLGAPTPIDGYANGWPVSPGCRDVSFTFGPNRLALISYVLSGVGAFVCVLLIGWALWRRRRAAAAPPPPAPTAGTPAPTAGTPAPPAGTPAPPAATPAPPAAAPLPPARALVWALPAAIVFGFVFGYVPGIVSLPAIAFVLWRGIGARPLTLAAFVLLAVLTPVVYLVHAGRAHGGNQYGYAMAHLGAHYVGVAAIGLLVAALWRSWRPHSGGETDRIGH